MRTEVEAVGVRGVEADGGELDDLGGGGGLGGMGDAGLGDGHVAHAHGHRIARALGENTPPRGGALPGRVRRQGRSDLLQELRDVIHGCIPKDVEIELVVAVDQPVPHADDLRQVRE